MGSSNQTVNKALAASTLCGSGAAWGKSKLLSWGIQFHLAIPNLHNPPELVDYSGLFVIADQISMEQRCMWEENV